MVKLEYVIRTVGERTEEVCIELVRRQKESGELISILKERTHVAAVEKTFGAGLKSEAQWLVAIDADMLLLPNAISEIKKELLACGQGVFVVHPAIFDKSYRMKRWGITVYRTAMLGELYDEFMKIRDDPHTKIEGAAIKALRKRGKQALFSRNVTSIHDYEQYYRDIYRKTYLNTIRNPGTKMAEQQWRRWSKQDPDFQIMLLAFHDATAERRTLANSVNDFDREELQERVESLGLKEKGSFGWREFNESGLAKNIEKKVNNPAKGRIFNDFFETRGIVSRAKGLLKKLARIQVRQ